jgi:hypothetical protein
VAGGDRLERNDAIAWAVATGVWIAVLALLLWLASRERRGVGPWLRWLGPRVAGGLALWVACSARHAGRNGSSACVRNPTPGRAFGGQHSGSRAP